MQCQEHVLPCAHMVTLKYNQDVPLKCHPCACSSTPMLGMPPSIKWEVGLGLGLTLARHALTRMRIHMSVPNYNLS